MDWQEVNCIIEALDVLIDQYRVKLTKSALSEDERSDLSNDLAYAQILQGKYEALRDDLARA
jgi:hypothetical protein